jgi:hypothetical protein
VPDRTVGGQIEFGVTPSHERPSIHAIGDQPGGRTFHTFNRDGVVAERGHEAIALGWRGAAAGEEEECDAASDAFCRVWV